MSKRVANTREKTARNGRIRHSHGRKINQSAQDRMDERTRIADITKIDPKLTIWTKIKNYFRRQHGNR